MSTEKNKHVVNPIYDCTHPSHQSYVAGLHAITKNEFDTWVKNFPVFNPQPGTQPLSGQPITKTQVETKLNGYSCKKFVVKIEGDENRQDNGDITFDHFGIPATKYYPIALFWGIIHLYNPDTFIFYKARKSQNNFDIVFEAKQGNETVYYGDLSNDVATIAESAS